ncbi:HD-GYP domain-containing protein [Herbaspirillum huttiense]|uniref:HD-GYP domain-containing protein n=1 Tax=Herbaspirillum huttiense TaxID=863372 RepID=UPI001AC486A4|nr:HD-GYP domain-containing protein [Herbaspirillum huttiense]MBN9358669.1 HD-GYP domain-containing protein [Herbaspirillum huttiense]MEE1639286.1 HD-GYP domain-containing protein [Herbaspirillum huttiense NC40101]
MTQLKKISVNDLAVGMYFSGFDGPWIDNPFWRSKFLIEQAADVSRARSAGFEFCWIDVSLGRDVIPGRAIEAVDVGAEPGVEPVPLTPEDEYRNELSEALRLYESAKVSTQQMFRQARLGKTLDVAQCQDLVEEIAASVTRNSNALLSIIRLKRADEYTYLHSIAVCTMMVALARTLGMDNTACKEAGLAGYLHDVGKAFIPLDVLNKPGKLTDQEFRIIQRHPTLGYEYLSGFAGVPDYVLDVCLHHHEKIDGTGYPGRQQGNQIDLYSRMAAVCDVYDAITSDRTYKSAWDPAESLARMASWSGHFDRPIFLTFVKTLGIYPIGSIVKLRSGRTALVIRQNHKDLTKPVVKAFTTALSIESLESEIIDLSSPDQDDVISERSGQDWIRSNGLVLDSLKALVEGNESPG